MRSKSINFKYRKVLLPKEEVIVLSKKRSKSVFSNQINKFSLKKDFPKLIIGGLILIVLFSIFYPSLKGNLFGKATLTYNSFSASQPKSLQLSSVLLDEPTDSIEAKIIMTNGYPTNYRYKWYLNNIALSSNVVTQYKININPGTVNSIVGSNTVKAQVYDLNKNSLLLGTVTSSFTLAQSALEEPINCQTNPYHLNCVNKQKVTDLTFSIPVSSSTTEVKTFVYQGQTYTLSAYKTANPADLNSPQVIRIKAERLSTGNYYGNIIVQAGKILSFSINSDTIPELYVKVNSVTRQQGVYDVISVSVYSATTTSTAQETSSTQINEVYVPNVAETSTPEEVSPVCGNNLVESGEVCDGTALNNQICASRGYTGGTLGCSTNCLSYVTSACYSTTTGETIPTTYSSPVCGNNLVESGEVSPKLHDHIHAELLFLYFYSKCYS